MLMLAVTTMQPGISRRVILAEALCLPVLTAALVAFDWSVAGSRGAAPSAVCGPLFHEATNEFRTMTTTL